MQIPSFTLYADTPSNIPPHFLHIETISARSRKNNWTIRPHRHPELFQFLLLSRGHAEMHLEGRVETLPAPVLTAVIPNAVHGYAFEPDTQGYVLTVRDSYLTELASGSGDRAAEAGLGRSAVIALAHGRDETGELLDAFERVAKESRESRKGRGALMISGLLQIVGHFTRLLEDDGRTEHGGHDTLFERFRRLVEERFHEPLRITDYADLLATSERTLRRTTQARSGQTPGEILKQRVLLEAQRDLLYTARPVADVAYRLGFEDQAYFSRFFAAGTGTTPTRFRKLHAARPVDDPETDMA